MRTETWEHLALNILTDAIRAEASFDADKAMLLEKILAMLAAAANGEAIEEVVSNIFEQGSRYREEREARAERHNLRLHTFVALAVLLRAALSERTASTKTLMQTTPQDAPIGLAPAETFATSDLAAHYFERAIRPLLDKRAPFKNGAAAVPPYLTSRDDRGKDARAEWASAWSWLAAVSGLEYLEDKYRFSSTRDASTLVQSLLKLPLQQLRDGAMPTTMPARFCPDDAGKKEKVSKAIFFELNATPTVLRLLGEESDCLYSNLDVAPQNSGVIEPSRKRPHAEAVRRKRHGSFIALHIHLAALIGMVLSQPVDAPVQASSAGTNHLEGNAPMQSKTPLENLQQQLAPGYARNAEIADAIRIGMAEVGRNLKHYYDAAPAGAGHGPVAGLLGDLEEADEKLTLLEQITYHAPDDGEAWSLGAIHHPLDETESGWIEYSLIAWDRERKCYEALPVWFEEDEGDAAADLLHLIPSAAHNIALDRARLLAALPSTIWFSCGVRGGNFVTGLVLA